MYFNYKKKSYRYSIIILSIIILGIILYPILFDKQQTNDETEAQQVDLALEKKLVLITHYVVGDDLIETRIDDIESIDEVVSKYPNWTLKKYGQAEIVLEKSVEDLAPELKDGLYFGLGPDGYLTLYHENSEETKVIETFFRIDIEKLETGLPKEPVEQLYNGIPVQDMAEYNSVLSTFSEYSLE